MREVCFCGWIGLPEDRLLTYSENEGWRAACPTCGRRDRVDWLSPVQRLAMFQRAARFTRE